MNKSAATESGRQGEKVRALGVSLRPCSMETASAAALCAMDLRSMGSPHLPGRRHHHRHRRQWRDLRQVDQTPWSALDRRSPRSTSRDAITRMANLFRCIPPASPATTSCASCRVGAPARGGRVWVPKAPGDSAIPKPIPQNERWYFLEEWYPKYGNLVPRDIATRPF